MFRWISIFVIVVSYTTIVTAQRVYKTASGQRFILLDEGTWEIYKDTTLTTIAFPEIGDDIFSDNSSESEIINIIKEKANENEVNALVKLNVKNNEIAATELAYKQLKLTDNKVALIETEQKLKKLKTDENKLLVEYGKSTQYINRANILHKLDPKKQKKEINELKKLLKITYKPKVVIPVRNEIQFEPVDNEENITLPLHVPKDSVILKPQHKIADKIPAKKVVPSDCNINTVEYTDDNKIDFVTFNKSYLFAFTPPKLKNYFKNKQYMIANAGLNISGKETYLEIDLTHFSKDAIKSYGYIPEANLITIQFVSGKLIRLKAAEDAIGKLETYTANTIFKLKIRLDKETKDLLSKIPIDKIGIMWSSGFETYEIYQVDFLIRQFKCVKNL
jgi:hypothetical protein